MMKRIVLIGGGGHCRSVLDTLLRVKEFERIIITDPYIEKGTKIFGCPVVGDDSMLEKLKKDGFDYAFITVGSITDASLRIKLVSKANDIGFKFPIIIDPSATVSANSSLGAGTFVGKNSVINADVAIGEHCIINTGCIIEHECSVGDFTHVSVGTILCGNVRVGKESFIGAGATIIQGISIGNKTVISANSTILSDVKTDRLKLSTPDS